MELSHEPEAAFLGGTDGLDFYRFIVAAYKSVCGNIAFECGINQHKEIAAIFKSHGFTCEIIKDYSKTERIIVGSSSEI